MSTLDKRLQILIDEQRLKSVQSAAREHGQSVGEWVRSLIDERLKSDSQADRVRDFLEYTRSVEPLFEGDSVDLVRESRDARADHLLNLKSDDAADRAA
jgi:hypothetical protein